MKKAQDVFLYLKRGAKKCLSFLEPVVLRAARYYGIETNRGPLGIHDRTIMLNGTRMVVHGSNKVVLAGDIPVPKSTYFNTRSGDIYIGGNTIIGEHVMFLTGKHLNIAEADTQKLPLHHVPEKGRDIVIGKGCWIASGAMIIGGVRVGDYSVVAAGAVVSKDVPERVVVGGIPARIIKKL